ncbi:MAG: FHA domain-containing protein [Synergistaceae bacterium]|jgi:pSer/pThr/pTyr-binding forkhead associated (FHA) protein|nr:FHA domain-containing protein [Synergistaceae bacterium]
MELIKLCPACKEENPVSEIVCRVCMTNLASVSPAPPHNPLGSSAAQNAGSTEFSPPEALTLIRLPDGPAISVRSGCILGRAGAMSEFFKESKTVSRSHARVIYKDGTWGVEDMGSTNGTWLNGRRIENNAFHSLQKGDTLTLSLACEMRVM